MLERLPVPGPRALLMVALGGRLLLAGVVLSQPIRPVQEGGVGLGVLLALFAVTVLATLSLLRDLTAQRMPQDAALLLQAIVDVLLVSLLVAVMGGEATPLAAIYVALVTIYALVLPLGRALVAVAFAASSYVLVAVGSGEGQPVEFWTQVGVIAGIGGLIAVLGRRLADAAAKQSALVSALEQVRLEADEILATIQSGVMTVDGEGKLGYINPRGRRILGGGQVRVATSSRVRPCSRRSGGARATCMRPSSGASGRARA